MKDFIINVLIFAGLTVLGFALKTLGGFVTTLITNYLDNKERIIQPAFIGLSFCNFLFSLIFYCGFLPAIFSFFYMLNMYKTMSVILSVGILYAYCAAISACHISLLPNYIIKKSEYWCFFVTSFMIIICRYLLIPFVTAFISTSFDVEKHLYAIRIGINCLFFFAALLVTVYHAIKTKKCINYVA